MATAPKATPSARKALPKSTAAKAKAKSASKTAPIGKTQATPKPKPAKKSTTKTVINHQTIRKTVSAAARTAQKHGEKLINEEMRVASGQVIEKVRELIAEGNVRRIRIKQKDKTLLELPVSFAAIGVVLAPQLAAIGALVALIHKDIRIEIERTDKPARKNGSK